MKSLVFLILILSCISWSGISAHGILRRLICESDYTEDFQKAIYDFTTKFTKQVAVHSFDHFVVSPLTIWLTIAAIAEGAHGHAQRDLFYVLNLPNEKCIRQKYYEIARSLEIPGNDVLLFRNRALVIDDSPRINTLWADFVTSEQLLNITRIPMRTDTNFTVNYFRKTITSPVDIIPYSNSALTDSLNYSGKWTTAFSYILRGPFYSDLQQKIGTAYYMTAQMQVRLAYLPTLNAKVLELPVGQDGRYKMLIFMGLGNKSIRNVLSQFRNSIIVETIAALKISPRMINIAIPILEMISEFDARFILEKLGISNLWTDSKASRFVSSPAPIPEGLLHHASVKLVRMGVYPPLQGMSNYNFTSKLLQIASNSQTGAAAAAVGDFIANKPFMYVLIDAKYKMPLFVGSYSVPTPGFAVKWTI